jgi:putative endonuclease
VKTLGDHFEQRAAQWLQDRGQQVLARNFRARTGEIDLITREADLLIFVEVKARSHPGFGGAAITVDRRKQARILRTAQVFLQRHPRYSDMACRFDVLAFEPPQSPGECEIRWIQAAFTN